ncbi:hypothetical protein PFNF135_01621 [Plasmodium falciparum NF135/5.C10]|uniref:Uncharacterized protein n=1 Tax=Plasmodium falciparum NF135/5.C10 TaxID=1036726 RepID=W4IK34_PLAFA|nr:hypothetical protein PFNF135_01621 [Plasmodium falciparum NF135/5.C10]
MSFNGYVKINIYIIYYSPKKQQKEYLKFDNVYQDEEKITCSYFSYLFLHLPYLTLMHIYIRIEYSHNLCTCIILKKIRYVYKIYVK